MDYIEKLRAGETVSFRPRGQSMTGRIESGQLCTVVPIDPATLRVGDIVLCRVGRYDYLHLIRAMFFEDADGDGATIHPDSHLRAAFAVNALALLVLGIFGDPLFHWCQAAFAA